MSLFRGILVLSLLGAMLMGTAGVALFLGTAAVPSFSVPTATWSQSPIAMSASRPPLTATECRFALRGSSVYSKDDDIGKMEAELNGRFSHWLTPPIRRDRYRLQQAAVFWTEWKSQYETITFFCFQRSSRKIKDTARTPPAGY